MSDEPEDQNRPTRFDGGPITGQRKIPAGAPGSAPEAGATPVVEGSVAPKKLSPAERIGWFIGLGLVVLAVMTYYTIRDQPWFALRFGDAAERQGAAVRLADRGERGVPELIILSVDHDADVRRAAVEALALAVEAEPKAIPPLVRALEDANGAVRHAAVRGLARAAPDPRAAEALIQALGRPDPGFREAIATALGGFGAAAEPAVPALLAMSNNHLRRVGSHGDIAKEALDALGADALPGLVRATGHVNPGVRSAAMRRLERLAQTDEAAKDALVERSGSPFADVRAAATLSRATTGGATPDLLDRLARLLDSVETHEQGATGLRSAAATPIVGPATAAQARAIVPRLLSFGGEDDIDRRTATTLVLALGDAALQPLIAVVTKAVEPERRRAIVLLGKLAPNAAAGPDRSAALDALRADLLADRDPRLVADAVARFGADGEATLIAAVANRQRGVRSAAIAALVTLAPSAGSTQALALALDGPRDSSEAAASALVSLGALGAEALTRSLLRDDQGARRLAAKTLAAVPAFPVSAHPALIEATRVKDTQVRISALRALGPISPRTDSIASALDRATRDKNARVRRTAAEARSAGRAGVPN